MINSVDNITKMSAFKRHITKFSKHDRFPALVSGVSTQIAHTSICNQISDIDSITNASKKWTMPLRNWKLALNRFTIAFEDRVADFLYTFLGVYTVKFTLSLNLHPHLIQYRIQTYIFYSAILRAERLNHV